MTAHARITSGNDQPIYQAYAIEVDDDTVGIVVRDQDGYTFHAADPAYFPLDHLRFPSASAAQKAAQGLRRNRPQALRSASWRKAQAEA